jgi:hypothetical protein
LISPRWPNFFISQRFKSNLVSMCKEKNYLTGKLASTMAVYRALVKHKFTDYDLANSNADSLKKNQPILNAFNG